MTDLMLSERDARGVTTLTLNRPDKRNALNIDLMKALRSALEAAGNARVIVLRGAGEAFCAGLDLEEAAAWQEMDYTNHGEVKDSVADAVSTAVQIIGGIVLAVIPGTQAGSAAIWANIIAQVALQASAMAMKAMIKGNSYGWEDGLADLANLAVTAATAGIGSKIGGIGEGLGKKAAEMLAKVETLKKFASEKLFSQVMGQFFEGGFDQSKPQRVAGLQNAVSVRLRGTDEGRALENASEHADFRWS